MLLRKLRSMMRDRHGVAAMEMAMMAPVLLSVLLGGVEMTRYLMISEKTDNIATLVADMVTQEKSTQLTQSVLSDYVGAGAQVMYPYTFGSNGIIIISSVTQTGTQSPSNPPKVSWQYSGGGTYAGSSRIGTVGQDANMPVGFTMNPGDNVIVTEVYYNYTTLFGSSVIGGAVLYRTAYYMPRLGALSATPS